MPPARQSTIATIVLSLLLGGCLSSVVEAPSPEPSVVAPPPPSASIVATVPTTAPAPSDSPASSADVATVTTCPTEPTSIETLIGLRMDGGPLADRYGAQLNEHALECLKGATVTFAAFVASPEGLGGTVSYQLTPAWLDTWNSAARYLAASDRVAEPGAPFGPFLPVAVPPDLRPAFDGQRGRWIKVSGQLDSPAAQGCNATPGSGPDVPPPADILAMCRTSFAIAAIAPIADPCPTKVTLRTILATAEDRRADCFGGTAVSFVAAGSSINNVWPGRTMPSGYQDWIFGAGDLVFDDTSLAVFVPEGLSLPDAAGTPWANRDTIGGSDSFWAVTGHFDDALADACVPDEGYTLETATHDVTQVVLSKGEVNAFCRNHLVVDRLTWLPHATASSVTR
jgi:hypothetical protein